MRILFEKQSTAQIAYPIAKQIKVEHWGRDYVQIGKSYEQLNSVFSKITSLIGLVALSILLIGIPLLFSSLRCTIKSLYKEITSKQEKIIHFIPKAATSDEQHASVNKLALTLKSTFNPIKALQIANIKMQQAICFTVLNFGVEKLKREFIIKPTNNQSFDTQFFEETVNKIQAHLDDYVDQQQASLGACEETQCAIFFKDQTNKFHAVYDASTSEVDLPQTFQSIDRSVIQDLNQQEFDKFMQLWTVKHLQFPSENHFQNGDFVPGTFYQNLNVVPPEKINTV